MEAPIQLYTYLRTNCFPQITHEYGFSFVCDLKCRSRCSVLAKCRSHKWHRLIDTTDCISVVRDHSMDIEWLIPSSSWLRLPFSYIISRLSRTLGSVVPTSPHFGTLMSTTPFLIYIYKVSPFDPVDCRTWLTANLSFLYLGKKKKV